MSANEYKNFEQLNIEREIFILNFLKSDRVALASELKDEKLQTLSSRVIKNKIKGEDALKLSLKILEILDFLWKEKVIFNNLNPDTVLVSDDLASVKLLGLKRSSTSSRDSNNHLRIFEITDNFNYISPEQTGRMNRSIDFRSDIYSLGALVYYMLTGLTLYNETEVHRLVHDHLTKAPQLEIDKKSICGIKCEEILRKMLQKNADERYQSASGICDDIEYVLANVNQCERLEFYQVAQTDFTDKFIISEKIFGREREQEIIMNAYHKVVFGRSRIILVEGGSGVGKTALVNEVRKPITEHNGYFLSGKYDQLNKRTPFSSIIQALSMGIDEVLLSENANSWRNDLRDKLGDNVYFITRYFPKLINMFGAGDPPELSNNSVENQNLLNSVFGTLIYSLKANERPLVLFLDDMQWADNATLSLLRFLTTDRYITNILIICGYRDNEIGATHPFFDCIQDVQSFGGEIEKIHLNNLVLDDILQLVATSLNRSLEEVSFVANMLFNKTQGNAFFVKELLKSFYDHKLVYFDHKKRKWDFSENEILKSDVTDNLMLLLIQKLNGIDKDVLHTLQSASVIGARFDMTTLAEVAEQSSSEAAENIKKCLDLNYLLPLDANYKYINQLKNVYLNASFKFSHDKIQQAAYESISPQEKINTHLKLLEIILAKFVFDENDVDIFEVAYHLDKIRTTAKIPDEQKMRIYKKAGTKAYAAGAYQLALGYFESAKNLTANNHWESNYAESLEISTYLADCYYLNAKTEEAEKLFNLILDKAKTKEDKSKIYEIQMNFYTNQGRSDEAITIAVKALKLYGIKFPQNAKMVDVIPLLIKVKLKFLFKSDDQILNNHLLVDQDAVSAMKILSNVSPSCFNQSPESMLVNCLHSLLLTLEHGNTGVSSFAISLMGFVEAIALSNYTRARELMVLASKLNTKLGAKDYEAKVIFAWSNFVQFYHSPIRESIPWLKKGYDAGVACGDLNFANFCLYSIMCRDVYTGEPLANSYRRSLEYSLNSAKVADRYASPMMQVMRVYLSRMSGESDSHFDDKDKDYNLISFEAELNANDVQNRSALYIFEIMFNFYKRDYDQALSYILTCDKFAVDGTQKQIFLYDFYFFSGMTLCSLVKKNSTLISKSDASKLTSKYKKALEKLAAIMPSNFRSRFYLLNACEMNAFKEECGETVIFEFQKAVNYAIEDGYKQIEAIAYEYLAEYYNTIGLEHFYSESLSNSIKAYQAWGASFKVNQITENSHKISISYINQSYDFAKLIDMTTAISKERNVELLIDNIISSSVKYTNANMGAIVDSNRLSKNNFPRSIIEYVFNTSEALIIDELKSSPFRNDQYIVSQGVKSVLALPLKVNGIVRYVLYLESSELNGNFTQEKFSFMNYITSQIALSLENAVVFDQLEKKVYERTEELSAVLDSKESLVRVLCHDLTNLLQIILGFTRAHEITPSDNIEKQNQFWEKIKIAAYLQKDLIDHVRQLESVNSGKIKLNLTVEEILPVIESSLDIYQSQIESKKLIINIQKDDFKDIRIVCEKTSLLNNVINNAISNAIKFSNNGGVISFGAALNHGHFVLSVQDYGIGMPDIIRNNLFSKRAPTTRPGTNGERGTGFGMPLLKTYIELMNGAVEVKSTEFNHKLNNQSECGTTFHLKFKMG